MNDHGADYDTDELGEDSNEEEGNEAGAPPSGGRNGDSGKGGTMEGEGKVEVEEVIIIDLKARRRRGAHEKHSSRVTGFMPPGRVKRLEARKAREAAARGETPAEADAGAAASGRGSRYMEMLRDSPLGITGRWVPQEEADIDDAPELNAVPIVTAPAIGTNSSPDSCWSFTHSASGDGKSQLVYGGGSNSSGELGLGSDHPFVFVTIPRAATLPKDMLARMRKEGTSPVVTAGAAGLGFSVVCVGLETMVAGTNIFGQLGIGRQATAQGWRRREDGQFRMVAGNLQTFEPVAGLSGIRVTQIACGYAHTVCGTSDGRILSWGLNFQGQLGLGQASSHASDLPQQVMSLIGRHAQSIGCGRQHSLVSFADGTIVSFGQNNCGQLGLGSVRRGGVPANGACLPREVRIAGGLGVERVAAGSHHSLAVCEDGSVWGFGNNAHGELGVGEAPPGHIEALSAEDGEMHELEHPWVELGAMAAGGGKFDVRPTPTRALMPEGSRAVRLACGGLHSIVAVSMPGKQGPRVYGFGADGGGQLGLGRMHGTQVLVPTEIIELRGLAVSSISLGMFHSTVTTCGDGSVPVLYSWGMNWFTREAKGDRHESPALVQHPNEVHPLSKTICGPCANHTLLAYLPTLPWELERVLWAGVIKGGGLLGKIPLDGERTSEVMSRIIALAAGR